MARIRNMAVICWYHIISYTYYINCFVSVCNMLELISSKSASSILNIRSPARVTSIWLVFNQEGLTILYSISLILKLCNILYILYWASSRGVIEGVGGRRPQGKKRKKKGKKKKRKKRKKEEKEREKKGTMNKVKLLHIKCCFSNFSIVWWH